MGLFDDVFKSGGQIDEEYRHHLEHLKAQQYMEVEQRRIDKMMQSQMYGSALNTYGTGIGAQLGAQHAAQQTAQQYNQAMQQKVMNQAIKPLPRFDPNKSEAFQIPLSQAVTMWQVKHGDNWFDGHQPKTSIGDDFYADVFGRLKSAELFESIDGWYRLKENVENLLANH